MSSTEVRGAREIPLFIKDEIVAHAIVDDRDFEWLNQRTWGANISGLTKEGRPAYWGI